MKEVKPKDIHEGHRKRLLAQVYKNGLDNMSEVQVLEFVLTLFIPRKDTNELAHVLLNRFQNLKGVLDAKYDDLIKIDGIGPRSAKLMKLLPQVFQYYLECEFSTTKIKLANLNDTVIFLAKLFATKTEEEFYALFINSKQELIHYEKLSIGSQHEVTISCKDIVEKCVKYRPAYLILSHNHPNGSAEPSSQDITTTNKIMKLLFYNQVLISDHIIIGDDGYYSFNNNHIIETYYAQDLKMMDDMFESNIYDMVKNTKVQSFHISQIIQKKQNSD